ncbi:MAG TPA: tetratricopeptide repeat protein [Candidatus Dormibacteraeota bacterium]|nr:tetratricopeptide repeat protein [Candidatus Dormibacteraeota bacterium]
MKPEFNDHLKPKGQFVEEAVQAALAGRWEDAAELNRSILERFGTDEEANNRLGKAMTELGRFDEAKAAYEATLALNPLNTIAQKNRAKLDVLAQSKDVKIGPTRVDLNLFVEEQGKTTSTQLESVDDPNLHNKIGSGDIAELRIGGDSIMAETVRGVKLGTVEARLARRLIKFIQGGNRYLAAVTSVEPGMVKVMIRETYQDPKFAGKPSFPQRRKREAEAFRPYAKESLLARDMDSFRSDDDEEADDGADVEESVDELEGLNVVDDDDAEPLDFSDEPDAEIAQDVGDDDGDDDDEDDE